MGSQLCRLGPNDGNNEDNKPLQSSRASNSNVTTLRLIPSSSKKALRCYKEVNISSFHYNIQSIQKKAEATGCETIAVVKANAYGHGVIRVVNECLKCDINTFGVATAVEGIELRERTDASIDRKDVRIIVLGASVVDEYELFAEYNLDLMLSGPSMVDSLIKWCKTKRSAEDKRANVIQTHCMIDTGMSRMGFQVDDCLNVIKTIHDNGPHLGLKLTGLCTHLAHAANKQYTLLQFDRFTSVLTKLREQKINVEMFHFENSESVMTDAIDNHAIKSYIDHDHDTIKVYVRIGIALYGFVLSAIKVDLKPMMSLHAQIREIEHVKKGTAVSYDGTCIIEEDVVVATLAIGYADGYPRAMTNKKQCVRIGDELYSVSGRVCMDTMMVNLGNKEKNPKINDIKIGDYAVLFGPKHVHQKNVSVDEMEKLLDATYNILGILCNPTMRCPVIYVE